MTRDDNESGVLISTISFHKQVHSRQKYRCGHKLHSQVVVRRQTCRGRKRSCGSILRLSTPAAPGAEGGMAPVGLHGMVQTLTKDGPKVDLGQTIGPTFRFAQKA